MGTWVPFLEITLPALAFFVGLLAAFKMTSGDPHPAEHAAKQQPHAAKAPLVAR